MQFKWKGHTLAHLEGYIENIFTTLYYDPIKSMSFEIFFLITNYSCIKTGNAATCPPKSLCHTAQTDVLCPTAGGSSHLDTPVAQPQKDRCLCERGTEGALPPGSSRTKQAKPNLTWEQSSGLWCPSSSSCV